MLSCATLTLCGCAKLMGSGATEAPAPIAGAVTFCQVARPITWSSRDTDETIRAVKEANAVGVRLCHWKGVS